MLNCSCCFFLIKTIPFRYTLKEGQNTLETPKQLNNKVLAVYNTLASWWWALQGKVPHTLFRKCTNLV